MRIVSGIGKIAGGKIKKLSRALEVYEVVKWLLNEKNFQLYDGLSEKKVKDLSQKFDELRAEVWIVCVNIIELYIK